MDKRRGPQHIGYGRARGCLPAKGHERALALVAWRGMARAGACSRSRHRGGRGPGDRRRRIVLLGRISLPSDHANAALTQRVLARNVAPYGAYRIRKSTTQPYLLLVHSSACASSILNALIRTPVSGLIWTSTCSRRTFGGAPYPGKLSSGSLK
jgi:hypothetical protein